MGRSHPGARSPDHVLSNRGPPAPPSRSRSLSHRIFEDSVREHPDENPGRSARPSNRLRPAPVDGTLDAIVCLFSAIGYTADLLAAVGSMARHVAANGVLIVEPWFTPNEWVEGRVHLDDHEGGGTRVVRMTHSGLDGNVSVIEMHHLVGTSAGVEHTREVHRLTLFTDAEYRSAFRAAGLSCQVDQPGPFGRGALIGRPIA